MEIDDITGIIVDSAMKVHTAIGPGLLEGVYGICLTHELRKRGLRVEEQVVLAVKYDGIEIPSGYRLDLMVEGLVIVELKTVEKILDVHRAQLLSYLRMSGKTVGLLINFNVTHLRDGISRIVNSRHWTKAAAAK
jgi:GxxExxY protein